MLTVTTPGLALVLTLGVASPALAAPAHIAARTNHRTATWEVILGTRHTRKGAETLDARAKAKGLRTIIKHDGRQTYEVAIEGFKTRKAATAESIRIRPLGFRCTIKRD
jgi:sporulation related protein